MTDDLERLYQDARSALKARDYDRASEWLRQILLLGRQLQGCLATTGAVRAAQAAQVVQRSTAVGRGRCDCS